MQPERQFGAAVIVCITAHLCIALPAFADNPASNTNDPPAPTHTLMQAADVKAPASESPATTTPADAPDDPAVEGLPDFGASLARMVFTLLGILAVLVVAAAVLPRLLGNKPVAQKRGMITVIDSLRLEPKRSIYLVEVNGKRLLVASSETGMALLSDRVDALNGGAASSHDDAGAPGDRDHDDANADEQLASRAFAMMLDQQATQRKKGGA